MIDNPREWMERRQIGLRQLVEREWGHEAGDTINDIIQEWLNNDDKVSRLYAETFRLQARLRELEPPAPPKRPTYPDWTGD